MVGTPIIDECPYNIECRATHEVEVGDYVVVFGEIVECHAEENVLRDRTPTSSRWTTSTRSSTAPASASTAASGPKLHDAYKIGNAFRKGELADE